MILDPLTHLFKRSARYLILIFLINSSGFFCQEDDRFEWDHEALSYSSVVVPERFKDEPLIIISEKVGFSFIDFLNKTLSKTVLMKINTKEGLASFDHVSLPESFDIAENKELWQQGRLSENKIPFIQNLKIEYFLCRVIKQNGEIKNLKPKKHYTNIRWIKKTGEFMPDFTSDFLLFDLEVGDLLEYAYGITYSPNYGSDIIYLSGEVPKLNIDYSFKYYVLPQVKDFKFVFTSNIPDSCISTEKKIVNSNVNIATVKVKLTNLEGVNYFIHALSAKQLPFVYFNMNYSFRIFDAKKYSMAGAPSFAWTHVRSGRVYDDKFHIKYNEDIEKFVRSFPLFENDSNDLKFIKTLNDTLSSFRYYSTNDLFYNYPRLYDLYSTEHLLKRRLTESSILPIYESILSSKKIFFYIVKIQDFRLGEINPLVRINQNYENLIFCFPDKKGFNFLIPRYRGMKYYLGEFPFYYEGALAALFPSDYKSSDQVSYGSKFKFIRTGHGTENQNIRIENAIVNVSTDSMKCHLNVKQSLSGQFSTILRHVYRGECIDSTISLIYFKKTGDKPNVSQVNYHIRSKSDIYPFKFEVDCSGKIALHSQNEIDLKNWFSFVFNKSIINDQPKHDFYFDFECNDIYNYVFHFNKEVNILNLAELNSNIDNDWFELTSSFKKTENDHVLSVIFKIKQRMLPKSEAQKLVEIVKRLDEINNYKIRFN